MTNSEANTNWWLILFFSKEMAYTKEYQLWILVKASNNHRVIEGLKIIRARPGSVILDVLVKHTENVLPEEAFEVCIIIIYYYLLS